MSKDNEERKTFLGLVVFFLVISTNDNFFLYLNKKMASSDSINYSKWWRNATKKIYMCLGFLVFLGICVSIGILAAYFVEKSKMEENLENEEDKQYYDYNNKFYMPQIISFIISALLVVLLLSFYIQLKIFKSSFVTNEINPYLFLCFGWPYVWVKKWMSSK